MDGTGPGMRRDRTTSEGSDGTIREMRSQIKRSFFTFINTILHNDAFPVIACQGQNAVWTVLQSVADGALHFPDPVVSTSISGNNYYIE